MIRPLAMVAGTGGGVLGPPRRAASWGETYAKLFDHAERDGATAGLAVVHLALDDIRVDRLLRGEHLGGARARRPSADDRH